MARSGRPPGRWLALRLRQRYDAAKESNLPSRGLPGPASFEDWMGHQARAAPVRMLRTRSRPAGQRMKFSLRWRASMILVAFFSPKTIRNFVH